MKIKFEIKSWFDGSVLFSLETDSLKSCLETAVLRGAVLSDADLSGADLRGAVLRGAVLRGADLSGAVLSDAALRGAVLSGADLRGAVLSDADLRGAVLSDADLSGADLRGAVLSDADLSDADLSGADLSDAGDLASDEESINNLDKVREIILDDQKRLKMDVWHEDNTWVGRTCAEEAVCGTAHCLAGWLQVCSTNPEVKKLYPQTAGILQAPVAAKMFFRNSDNVLKWLENRDYVKDIEESNARKAARAAKQNV